MDLLMSDFNFVYLLFDALMSSKIKMKQSTEEEFNCFSVNLVTWSVVNFTFTLVLYSAAF